MFNNSNRFGAKNEVQRLRRQISELEGGVLCISCKTHIYHSKRSRYRGTYLNAPAITVCIVTTLETEDSLGTVTRNAIAKGQILRPERCHLRNANGNPRGEVLKGMLSEVTTPYVAIVSEGDEYEETHLFKLMQTLLDSDADVAYSCGCINDQCGDETYCKRNLLGRTRVVAQDVDSAVTMKCGTKTWWRSSE